MIIDKMVTSLSINTDDMTENDWRKLEWKLASIEERIRMGHIMSDYRSLGSDIPVAKKKSKPYYRKGRWE